MTTLTERDHELLSQYLDDELAPAARGELETRLAEEPPLARTLERLHHLNREITDAYGSAASDTVPANVAALVGGGDKVRPLRRRLLPRAVWPSALAASLVVAMALVLVTGQNGDQHVTGDDPLLARALESEPSRANGWTQLGDRRQLRPVLTFPDRSGTWCREFLLRDGARGWRGVACRESGAWELQVVARESFLASDDAYRPAGTAASDDVAGFITRNAADIALGRDAERELINSGWRDAPR